MAALDAGYVLSTYARQPLELVSGQGSEVVGGDGRRYLDMVLGLSVSNFGHCHPRVVEAVREQVGRLIHCSNLYYTAPQARLAERLSKLANGGKVFFGNSGAEANEAAIKIARKRAQPSGGGAIVTLERSFHGRTMATLHATGQPEKHLPFVPGVPGYLHVPIGDVDALGDGVRRAPGGRLPGRAGPGRVGRAAGARGLPARGPTPVRRARRALHARRSADRSGPLRRALRVPAARSRSPTSSRWPRRWAAGCPSGRPSSAAGPRACSGRATTARRSAAARWWPRPRLAVLDLLDEPGLFARVEECGARLEAWLERLRAAGVATDVRRLGLMAAVDLAAGNAKAVVAAALDAGILLNATSDDTIRLLPSLLVTEAEIDRVGGFLCDFLAVGR